jgi:NAD-dependent SIR2 family protein deacetylase
MKKLVVLTGAGISAESGLKTFRDSDGLWEGYDIEEVATATAWKRNPALVLEFYNMRRRSVAEATPNAAHQVLAELERDFDVQIVTQNIDDLHERAGSQRCCTCMAKSLKCAAKKTLFFNTPYLVILSWVIGLRMERSYGRILCGSKNRYRQWKKPSKW